MPEYESAPFEDLLEDDAVDLPAEVLERVLPRVFAAPDGGQASADLVPEPSAGVPEDGWADLGADDLGLASPWSAHDDLGAFDLAADWFDHDR